MSRFFRFPESVRSVLLPLVAVAAAGCADAPTSPVVLQQLVEGGEWAYVGVPAALPGPQTWLPFLDGADPERAPLIEAVQRLQREARRERAAGRLEEAAMLEREATRRAVAGVSRAPKADTLAGWLGAVDAWCAEARLQRSNSAASGLASTLARVEALRRDAGRSLEQGDSVRALAEIADAAERIRHHAPEAVALRLIVRAEERLAGIPLRGSTANRARHLLRSARAELAGGDPGRALRRALYALQIAEGWAVSPEPTRPTTAP